MSNLDPARRKAVAASLGINEQYLYQCLTKRGRMRADKCPEIERETLGAVPCEALRDDLAWVRIADAEWPWHPAGRPLLDVAAVRLPAPIEQAA